MGTICPSSSNLSFLRDRMWSLPYNVVFTMLQSVRTAHEDDDYEDHDDGDDDDDDD